MKQRNLKMLALLLAFVMFCLPALSACNQTSSEIETVTGEPGRDGIDGKDGKDGVDGKDGKDGKDGQDGVAGKSAYELAVEKGYQGTLEEWLESLVGEAGTAGQNGSDGKSAYELAVEKGYKGTLEEWLASLIGETGVAGQNGSDGKDGQNGAAGKSAYEIAVENGFKGTEAEWLASLVGAKGEDGTQGSQGEQGINGDSGVGVANAYVNDEYHLILVLTDGNEVDAGYVGIETPALYTVIFAPNGQNVENLPESQKVVAGGYAVPPDAPTREDYFFWGWHLSPDAQAFIENPIDLNDFSIEKDVVLYAIWESDGIDIDDDGLSHSEEERNKTDPYIFDTDGDGLPDGDEVKLYQTNPLHQDSDGDGVSDGTEIALGLDPLMTKSDGNTADATREIHNTIQDDDSLFELSLSATPLLFDSIQVSTLETSHLTDSAGLISPIIEVEYDTSYDFSSAELVFDYSNVDLTGVSEDELTFLYLNEETGKYELVPSVVDTENKTIRMEPTHFSSYVVGLRSLFDKYFSYITETIQYGGQTIEVFAREMTGFDVRQHAFAFHNFRMENFDGACYGMSFVAYLNYMQKLPVIRQDYFSMALGQKMPGYDLTTTHRFADNRLYIEQERDIFYAKDKYIDDIILENISQYNHSALHVINAIRYWQGKQHTTKGIFANNLNKVTNVGKLMNRLMNDEPVVLQCWRLFGGHALLAYGLFQSIENPHVYYILVYDSNFPGQQRFVKMTYTGDGYSVEFDSSEHIYTVVSMSVYDIPEGPYITHRDTDVEPEEPETEIEVPTEPPTDPEQPTEPDEPTQEPETEPEEPIPDDPTANRVIRSLPFSYVTDGGTFDVYFDYTATVKMTLMISRPDGGIVSITASNYWDMDTDGNYILVINAGETVTLNFWTMDPDTIGSFTVSVLDGGTETDPEIPSYSEGLAFTSNGDGTCYVSGIGSCTDTDVVIPPVSPEGDRVTCIGGDAFAWCDSVTSVIFPDSLEVIEYSAFYMCKNLTDFTIPNSVTKIESEAFYGCARLWNITIPSSVTDIGIGAFACCSLGTVFYDGMIEQWPSRHDAFVIDNRLYEVMIECKNGSICAFYQEHYCDSNCEWGDCWYQGVYITAYEVTYADGITVIRGGPDAIVSVHIPISVNRIAQGVFPYSEYLSRLDGNLKHVFYEGTRSQWAKIDIDSNNDGLEYSTIHCKDGAILPES